MRKLALAFLVCLGIGVGANAATLSVTADKSTYFVGETITLTIVGDSEGASARKAEGFLTFDVFRVAWLATEQQPLTSFAGTLEWARGGIVEICGQPLGAPPGCWAFSQIGTVDGQSPVPVDGPLFVTMTLNVFAPGRVDFEWADNEGEALDFFGLTSAPGTSVLILPEPGTAALFGLGLVGLSLSRRRRKPSPS
jgi:hypothetical protein